MQSLPFVPPSFRDDLSCFWDSLARSLHLWDSTSRLAHPSTIAFTHLHVHVHTFIHIHVSLTILIIAVDICGRT